MKALCIEYDNCVGCGLCAMRCALEKTEVVNPAQSRINLFRIEYEGIVFPVVCRHCDIPACIPVCPVKCISKNPETGLVKVNEAECIGCGKCAAACPYEGPAKIPSQGSPAGEVYVNCDLCGGIPVCITVCPTATLKYRELAPGIKAKKADSELRIAKIISNFAQLS